MYRVFKFIPDFQESYFESLTHSSTDARTASVPPSTSSIFPSLSLTSFSYWQVARRRNECDLTSYNAQWNIREGKSRKLNWRLQEKEALSVWEWGVL